MGELHCQPEAGTGQPTTRAERKRGREQNRETQETVKETAQGKDSSEEGKKGRKYEARALAVRKVVTNLQPRKTRNQTKEPKQKRETEREVVCLSRMR